MKTVIAFLVVALLVSLCFGYGQSQERMQASAEAQRAEAARVSSQAKLEAFDRMFSAGNATIAGHRDVLFRDALASGAERIDDVPLEVRAPVLFALAEARKNIGEIEAALATYQEAAAAARESNDVRMRLRAQLRRAQLLYEHVNHREFAVAYDELVSDPASAGDALVESSILVLGADDARWLRHGRTADERADRALALWPVPEAEGDDVLRAELELRLLIEQAQRRARTADGNAALLAHVERMRAAVDRLRRVLGDEHPLLVAVRSYADVLLGRAKQRADALASLLDETRRKALDLGAGHPAVLARIDVALHFRAVETDAGLRSAIERLALQSARALPIGNVWRARATATLLDTDSMHALADMVTPEEVVEIGRMRCRDAPAADADCLDGRLAAARAMSFAGRPAEAIAILQAALAELPADADAAWVSSLNDQLQRVLAEEARSEDSQPRPRS